MSKPTDPVARDSGSLWRYANPSRFMNFSGRVLPILVPVTCVTLVAGMIWSLFFIPEDYQHGLNVKIMFVHVPAVTMAINCWLMMFVASLIWLVRRHHVSALAAKAAAPIGLTLTLVGLATGAIWGKPAWGTYWVWDPRLTSFMILALFYVGYISLWRALDHSDQAADITSILCIVGSIFAFLSRYAVMFWSQGLHQGSTLSLDAETHIDNAFYFPLLVCIAGFILLFVTLVLVGTRHEIRLRQVEAILRRNRRR